MQIICCITLNKANIEAYKRGSCFHHLSLGRTVGIRKFFFGCFL